jgi:hypothetical protein
MPFTGTAAYFVEQRKEAKGRNIGVLFSWVTFFSGS